MKIVLQESNDLTIQDTIIGNISIYDKSNKKYQISGIYIYSLFLQKLCCMFIQFRRHEQAM